MCFEYRHSFFCCYGCWFPKGELSNWIKVFRRLYACEGDDDRMGVGHRAHIPLMQISSLSLGVNCLRWGRDCGALSFSYPLARPVTELRTYFRISLYLGICLVSGPILASWPWGGETPRARSHPSLLLLHPLNLVKLNVWVQSPHSQERENRLVKATRETQTKTAARYHFPPLNCQTHF